jgi:branched-chain amino acid transport system substrate-binding protein
MHMKLNTRFAVVSALALFVVAAFAATALAKPAKKVPSRVAACTNVSVAFLGPLTGPVAFLGQEQLSWGKFAVSEYNRINGTRFTMFEGDTQLQPARARTVARQIVSNKKIMAVIGASGSQSVVASAGLLAKAGLASISPSATRTSLTGGQFKTFFRDVPSDRIQAPTIVVFVKNKLKAKNVVVIDSQDAYSVPLADAVQKGLRLKGVKVSRESVAATDTDFSSLVTNVGNDTDVVVFATQTATAAQTLSNQLREQGKKAVVFGTDGAYSPDQFKPRQGYVSAFAADLHFLPSAKGLVNRYNKFSKNKSFGTFGPPTYLATWIAMNAIERACANGSASRAEVTKFVRVTRIPSIFGGTFRFTPRGDVRGGKFFIAKVTNGVYKPA